MSDMEEDKPAKIAFLPEAQGSPRVWQAIERARKMAEEKGYQSMNIGLELSLKRRSDILDGFGREFFGTGMDGLEPKIALPAFLIRYTPRD